jgi:hypothetical protein
MGKIHELSPTDSLYETDFDYQVFYIILEGSIALVNTRTEMKRVFNTGETLGEEMLFSSVPGQKFIESARAITRSYVL